MGDDAVSWRRKEDLVGYYSADAIFKDLFLLLTYTIACFNSSESDSRIDQLIRAYVGELLEIFAWSKRLGQPPGNPIDHISQIMVCDFAVAILVSIW